MIVGFTAEKDGLHPKQKGALHELLRYMYHNKPGPWVFHHNDFVGGDAEAHEIAKKAGFEVITHPPIDQLFYANSKGALQVLEAKATLQAQMNVVRVSECFIAAPNSRIELPRGSYVWPMVNYAKKQRFTVVMLYPDFDGHLEVVGRSGRIVV